MEPQIIFFDGVCHLCNGFVDFVMRRDREALFRFAPLQGETARAKLPTEALSLQSMVLWSQGERREKSEAVLAILRELGGIWGVFALFSRILPRAFRDWAYDRVAANRYGLFGKRDTCRLPTPTERERFLP